MEYTVQKLGQLAGISTRTLRFYDEIGILKPARINASGYRLYGQAEVDRLQQILFYRELGVSLDKIKEIMTDPSFDQLNALRTHREQLLDRKKQLELLLLNVENTIALHEGRMSMSDDQKFEGLKKQLIEDNEKKYGKAVREKYGNETVDKSNAMLQKLTKEEYAEMQRLGDELTAVLADAFKQGDPAGELAQKAADMHRQWLAFTWSRYSKEAHAGLARMYVEDERFKAYYDAQQPGTAVFLRDAILVYTGLDQ